MLFARKEISKLKNQNLVLQNENTKLKAENDDLKKRLKACNEIYKATYGNLVTKLDEMLDDIEPEESDAQMEIERIVHGVLPAIKKED